MPLLEVSDLTVRFGTNTAVDRVSFGLERGEFVGLIGPNGAGKTTMIDAVTGLTPTTSGSVVFDGRDLSRSAPHARARAGIRRTFQTLELFEDVTVEENLRVAAESARWWSCVTDLVYPRRSREAAESVESALDLLDLQELRHALPADLSLGQRKLVTVARSLAGRPTLLLLDEPAAGLDSEESLVLGERLKDVAASGVTLLLVDHDMGLVFGVCDRILVLDFGALIANGTAETVRADDRVVRAYLGEEAEAHVGGELV